jgi:hypothetical protein
VNFTATNTQACKYRYASNFLKESEVPSAAQNVFYLIAVSFSWDCFSL